ncbi:sirohydrochlorin chelatase [Lysobacter korlensis]|uniref:Sirohydrochlorin chelatase n=1 Tax=Lysobacter korlensis TaxID=553636 RepID=A0ABV6RNQ5_9GAMM
MTLLAPARVRTSVAPALVAVSHGTSSPLGQRAVASLVAAVRLTARDLTVSAGFVDVQQPDVPATLGALPPERSAVTVPLLLSAGYHVHVDLRRALGKELRPTSLAGALGPDERLVDVLVHRLRQSGLRRSDRIVLGAAGSSDARAVADCDDMGRRLASRLGRPVTVGFISAASPRLPDAVARERERHPGARVVVSTYLLAPGYFADLAASSGADVTTAPLLDGRSEPHAQLVDLVLDRYDEAQRDR